MSKLTNIPVIDIFAGPGGLGEGFSSVYYRRKRAFDIKLSIEKDENAYKTLEMRSFFRKFKKEELPLEYYRVLEESDIAKRDKLKEILFDKYPEQSRAAREEVYLSELGSEDFPEEIIDQRISNKIGKTDNWVLIGGPPCQSYSIAGRARVGGINKKDHRVYLYKEYLRIIAVHHPSVFVMENVKGLLSAKVRGENIFHNYNLAGTILDIPVGYGRFQPLLTSFGTLLAADIGFFPLLYEKEQLGIAKSSVNCSAEHLPFSDKSVDVIFCFRLMQHLHKQAERITVLKEFKRVSRSWIVVSEYLSSQMHQLYRKMVHQPSKITILSNTEFEREIKSAELTIIKKVSVLSGLHAHRICLLSPD